MGLIVAPAGRTKDFTVTIKTAAGGYVALAADDVVRVKVHYDGTTVLDLNSSAVTANGSGVTAVVRGNGSTIHASATVRLAQADTSSFSGIYGIEATVVDNSETAPADAIKAVGQDVVYFRGSAPTGSIGLVT